MNMAGTPRVLCRSLVLMSVLVGCAKRGKDNPSDPHSPAMSLPGASGGSLAGEPKAIASLQSLDAGQADLAAASPAFLRLIAEPGVLPSDVQRGYDDVEAKSWFAAVSRRKYSLPSFRREVGEYAVFTGGSAEPGE